MDTVVEQPHLKPHEPIIMLTAQEAAWVNFRRHVEMLGQTDFGDEGLRVFYRTVGAYRELRDAHVDKRRRRKVEGKDTSLELWSTQRSDFRTKFFGVDEGSWVGTGKDRKWKAKRRFKGCSAEIVRYIRAYQSLWNIWWPHTPRGQKSKAKANARQAKRPEVQAAKRAYGKTDTAKTKAKKRSSEARKLAKGQAEQALYDSWAMEDAIEEALRDV